MALILMTALLAINFNSLNTSASKGTGPLGTHTITTRATDNGTSFTDASFTPNLLAPTTVTVNAGPDIDAANNDYRRIQNALNAAVSGDTIILSGTFDFTQPFAAAAWALGNDNTASTADDYEVSAPRGVDNVTLTATSLGSATIQGPGDLAAVNLEAFLVFDPSLAPGGTNQGWTISNLRILDFDLSIGSFAVGVSDFNNMTVTNNFIRIPTDLNATVAPADVSQNIGIKFSFGTNQTISNNGFQIAGDGVSDTGAGNFSTSVVMQSNPSSGAVYNGLSITGNVTHILNAQSANPQVTLGIWDDCQAHTSNITITNNSFLNDAVGNSPSLNLERAFRVTSHSSATSTVTYSGNTVNGANIGYQWLAGPNFSGNLAVRLIDDTITNCDTGVLVQSNGVAHLETDVITGSGAGGGVHIVTGMLAGFGANLNGIDHSFISGGSGDGVLFDATATTPTLPPTSIIDNDLSNNTGFGLKNLTANPVTALTNYWGSNLAANVAAKVSGPATFDPWLASGTDINASTGFQPFIYATTTTAANLTTLAGTAAADTGSMLNTSPVTLTMDGDTGFVPVAELLNVSIQLGNSDDVFTLGQTGIPTVLDGGTGNDSLVGTNVAQTWNITGGNSGNIPGAASSFSNVESLRGGTAADSFVFGAAGSLTQTIDGDLGTDTLNNSAIPGHTITPTGPGTLDGFKGTATGVGVGFDNINNFPSPSSVSGTKTASGTFAPNGSITYTVVLSNSSTFAQLDNPGDEFTDVLPAGLTLVSANATSGTAAANTGTNTAAWSGSIAGGGSVTITITATINSNAGGTTISNQGTINYDADGDGTNESSRLTDDPAVGGASDATSFFVCGNSIVVTANSNSGAGSLRQAILDACPGATITFNVTIPIVLSSELVIDKNLTIQGPTSSGLTISGNNASRIFNINAGVSLAISNLTIANGLASSGGGILNAGTLTITNSTISNNHTTNGANSGGPGFNGGNGGDGGGIFNTGTLNVINSTISGNQPGNGGDASGTDTAGNGGNGGGIYNSGGTLTSVNTTITNNKTGANGVNTTTTPTPGPFGNPGTGGGLYSSGGTVVLRNTIVAGNFSVFQKLGPPRSFANSDDDVNGTVDSLSSFNNLIGTDAGLSGISNGSNGNKIGTVGTPLSAGLAPLANNGGPTSTHLPQNGSPVIDAGNNALAKDQNSNDLATDQRGTGFDRILNGTVEIGAVEVNYGPPGSSADVGVTKSSNPNSALPDTNVTYTITVSNNGPNVATDATLTDPLPAGVTFVSLSSPGGWLCNSLTPGSGGTLTCTNPNLPLTVGAVFTLVVHINPGATQGSFITNQAQVSTSAFDPNNENDSSAASTLVIGPTSDLGVTKLASAGTSPADRDVRYTITVTNGGPAAAANVALNDTLPGDMTFVSVFSPAGWSCASHPAVGAGGTVTCTNPSLAVTSGQVFTLTGHIPPGASNGTFYFNQATVSSSTSDPNPDNNSSPAGTTVVACVTDPVVTTNADSGAGSLRQAIIDACDGGTIVFDMTQVVSPITLTSAELAINKNLTIQGPGANLLTVQRSIAVGTPRFRIFNIQSGTVNISGLTISNGDNAANGGAIENLGALTLNRLTLSNNHTSAGGSAIFNSSTGTVALSNSTLSGNQSDGFADGFAAVYNQGGAFTITNSTLTGNTNVGPAPGVAIFSESNSVTNVTNCTISKNTGLAEAVSRNGSGQVNLKNSIVSGNTGGDVSGITDNGNNLIGGNPLLAPLGNYGGPTQTMALLPGSPAINAGTSTGAPATDQRGISRVGAVDIGAFESRGFTISATSGNAQSTPILTAFGAPLVATVSSAFSEPVAAGMVIFTAPGSGASATFTGGVTTFNATINGGGQATATPTANGTAGGPYNVAATANGISSTATFSLTNQKGNQTITFGPLANKAFGDPDFGVSATASSGLPVSFAALGNCTVSGSTVHLTGGGSCTVTASQGGGTNYNAAPNVQQSFNIAKGSQIITFGALVNKTFGDPDFGVSATASSGLAVSFAALGNCTVSGSTVHLTGGGSCTVTASQGGDANYNPAPNVQQSFNIARAATTTALSSSINPSDIGQNVTFTATVSAGVGTPTGTVQFKDGANNLGGAINCVAGGGNTCTAQVSSSTLTTGPHTITAIYSGDTNFSGSTGTLSGGQVVTNQQALLLILDQSGPDPNQAAALDALLLLRDPFHVQSVASWWNFGPAPDRNTRVMVFVANLQLNPGETAAAVVVNLIDSNSLSYDVAAEDIRLDPITGFAQVTFRLPDTLFPGTCTLTVKAHGHVSNSATMRIAP
jgi:uncharacterized repeat protein (TIGR01451 family)